MPAGSLKTGRSALIQIKLRAGLGIHLNA